MFDASKLDLIAETADGVVGLYIIRDNPWTDADDELRSLQAKVNLYVAYRLDGQFDGDHPTLIDAPWEIVVQSYGGPPGPRGVDVIDQLAAVIPTYGGDLRHEDRWKA